MGVVVVAAAITTAACSNDGNEDTSSVVPPDPNAYELGQQIPLEPDVSLVIEDIHVASEGTLLEAEVAVENKSALNFIGPDFAFGCDGPPSFWPAGKRDVTSELIGDLPAEEYVTGTIELDADGLAEADCHGTPRLWLRSGVVSENASGQRGQRTFALVLSEDIVDQLTGRP